jgi:hypothetical protein
MPRGKTPASNAGPVQKCGPLPLKDFGGGMALVSIELHHIYQFGSRRPDEKRIDELERK